MQTTVCKCVSCIWKQCHSPHAMPNLLFVFVVYGCIQVTCQWPHNPVTDCGALMHRFCGGTASEQPNWLLEQCAVRQWVVTAYLYCWYIIRSVWQVAASTAYLAIGSGRPLFQLAALGLGIRLQALAGGLRLLLVIWVILILTHLQGIMSLCAQRDTN